MAVHRHIDAPFRTTIVFNIACPQFCALVGRDRCWPAVKAKKNTQKLLARPRCLCPRGMTAIRLAVKTKK
jgi:hypothetical protein